MASVDVPSSLTALNKLEGDKAEKVSHSRATLSVYLYDVHFATYCTYFTYALTLTLSHPTHAPSSRQFVHRAIDDACEKEGLHYDDYAKVLSLAEYSQLKHTLSGLIRPLSRDGIKKEEVSFVGCWFDMWLCCDMCVRERVLFVYVLFHTGKAPLVGGADYDYDTPKSIHGSIAQHLLRYFAVAWIGDKGSCSL